LPPQATSASAASATQRAMRDEAITAGLYRSVARDEHSESRESR
jgi:hypothetical protein